MGRGRVIGKRDERVKEQRERESQEDLGLTDGAGIR